MAEVADVLSVLAAVLGIVYAALVIAGYWRRMVRPEVALLALLAASATAGFLLRPLQSAGLIDTADRDVAAVVIRTVCLVVLGALAWHRLDRWLDRRRRQR